MLSLWQLLQIHACTKCGMCEEICPPFFVTKEKVLSGLNRIETIKEIVRRAIPLIGRLFFKEKDRERALKDLEFSTFRCTLCGACEMRCPVGLSLKDIWIALRHELYKEGYYPKKIDMIKENIEEEHNVFGEENEERAEWIEDLEKIEFGIQIIGMELHNLYVFSMIGQDAKEKAVDIIREWIEAVAGEKK